MTMIWTLLLAPPKSGSYSWPTITSSCRQSSKSPQSSRPPTPMTQSTRAFRFNPSQQRVESASWLFNRTLWEGCRDPGYRPRGRTYRSPKVHRGSIRYWAMKTFCSSHNHWRIVINCYLKNLMLTIREYRYSLKIKSYWLKVNSRGKKGVRNNKMRRQRWCCLITKNICLKTNQHLTVSHQNSATWTIQLRMLQKSYWNSINNKL